MKHQRQTIHLYIDMAETLLKGFIWSTEVLARNLHEKLCSMQYKTTLEPFSTNTSRLRDQRSF